MINPCFYSLLTTVLGKKPLTATTEHSEFQQEFQTGYLSDPRQYSFWFFVTVIGFCGLEASVTCM